MLSPPFYVVSDTHWFHHNIIKYCNRDMNHNRIMVDRWNKAVGPHDTVLHLGDVCFTADSAKRDKFFNWIAPSLNGKVYVIFGNHDKTADLGRFKEIGWTVIQPFTMRYREHDVSFDHYPVRAANKGEQFIRVHGHIHNSGYQSKYVKRKEMKRPGNVNVSVEVIDYTPQPIEKLLDQAVDDLKVKQVYYNVNGKRNGTRQADVRRDRVT